MRVASAPADYSNPKTGEKELRESKAYQAHQKAEGYANATVNRDMAALKRMFRLPT